MKTYERRATNRYPYYKLATWDARSMTFRDGKVAHATKADACAAAAKPGRYRVSEVTLSGRIDFAPFDVAEPAYAI